MADELANRKLDHLAAAKAQVLIAGNAGCASHLAAQAKARGQKLRVVHPVELIHQAIFGKPEIRNQNDESNPKPE
jgi:Fe-S oxidoreductase